MRLGWVGWLARRRARRARRARAAQAFRQARRTRRARVDGRCGLLVGPLVVAHGRRASRLLPRPPLELVQPERRHRVLERAVLPRLDPPAQVLQREGGELLRARAVAHALPVRRVARRVPLQLARVRDAERLEVVVQRMADHDPVLEQRGDLRREWRVAGVARVARARARERVGRARRRLTRGEGLVKAKVAG